MKAARAFQVQVPGFPSTYFAAREKSQVVALVANRVVDLGYYPSFGDALPAITVRRSTGFDRLAGFVARSTESGVVPFNPSDRDLWSKFVQSERKAV